MTGILNENSNLSLIKDIFDNVGQYFKYKFGLFFINGSVDIKNEDKLHFLNFHKVYLIQTVSSNQQIILTKNDWLPLSVDLLYCISKLPAIISLKGENFSEWVKAGVNENNVCSCLATIIEIPFYSLAETILIRKGASLLRSDLFLNIDHHNPGDNIYDSIKKDVENNADNLILDLKFNIGNYRANNEPDFKDFENRWDPIKPQNFLLEAKRLNAAFLSLIKENEVRIQRFSERCINMFKYKLSDVIYRYNMFSGCIDKIAMLMNRLSERLDQEIKEKDINQNVISINLDKLESLINNGPKYLSIKVRTYLIVVMMMIGMLISNDRIMLSISTMIAIVSALTGYLTWQLWKIKAEREVISVMLEFENMWDKAIKNIADRYYYSGLEVIKKEIDKENEYYNSLTKRLKEVLRYGEEHYSAKVHNQKALSISLSPDINQLISNVNISDNVPSNINFRRLNTLWRHFKPPINDGNYENIKLNIWEEEFLEQCGLSVTSLLDQMNSVRVTNYLEANQETITKILNAYFVPFIKVENLGQTLNFSKCYLLFPEMGDNNSKDILEELIKSRITKNIDIIKRCDNYRIIIFAITDTIPKDIIKT